MRPSCNVKTLEARFHDECFKKIIKKVNEKLTIDAEYASKIKWFLDSPDAGDENCKCSLCSKQIEEDACPIRLFKEVKHERKKTSYAA